MEKNLKTNNYKKALTQGSSSSNSFKALATEMEEDETGNGPATTPDCMELGVDGNSNSAPLRNSAKSTDMEDELDPDATLAIMDAGVTEAPTTVLSGKAQIRMVNSQYIGETTKWTFYNAQTIILHGVPNGTKVKEWKLIVLGLMKWTNLPIDPARAMQMFQNDNWKAQGCEVAKLSSIILPLTRIAKFRVAATRPDFPLFLNLKGRRYFRDGKSNTTSVIAIPNTLAYQPIPLASTYNDIGIEVGYLRGFPSDDSGAATEAVLQLCNQYFGQLLLRSQFTIILRPVLTATSKKFEGITFREYIGIIMAHATVNANEFRENIGITDATVVHTIMLPGYKLLLGRELSIVMKASLRDLIVPHICTRINNVLPSILPWTFLETLVEDSSNAISFRQVDFYYVETDFHISHSYLSPKQLEDGIKPPIQGNAFTLMSRKGHIAVQFLQSHQQRFAPALDTDGRLRVIYFEMPNWEHTKRCYGLLGGVTHKGNSTMTKGKKADHMGYTVPKEKKENQPRKPTLKLKAEWMHPDHGRMRAIQEEIEEEERRQETITIDNLSQADSQLMTGFFLMAKAEQRRQSGHTNPTADNDTQEWKTCHPQLLTIILNCSPEERVMFETVMRNMEAVMGTHQRQQTLNILQEGFNLHRQRELEGEDLLVATEEAVQRWIAQYPQSNAEYQALSQNQREHMEHIRTGTMPPTPVQQVPPLLHDRTLLTGTQLRLQIAKEAQSMEGPKQFTIRDLAQWKEDNPMGERVLDTLPNEERHELSQMANNILDLMDYLPNPCPCSKRTVREGITQLVLLNKYKDVGSATIPAAETEMKQWADSHPQEYMVLEKCIEGRQGRLNRKDQQLRSMMSTPPRNASPLKAARTFEPPHPPSHE